VVDPQGNSAAEARVSLFSRGGAGHKEVQALSADGSYIFEHLQSVVLSEGRS
jgi:hypothetical protein